MRQENEEFKLKLLLSYTVSSRPHCVWNQISKTKPIKTKSQNPALSYCELDTGTGIQDEESRRQRTTCTEPQYYVRSHSWKTVQMCLGNNELLKKASSFLAFLWFIGLLYLLRQISMIQVSKLWLTGPNQPHSMEGNDEWGPTQNCKLKHCEVFCKKNFFWGGAKDQTQDLCLVGKSTTTELNLQPIYIFLL